MWTSPCPASLNPRCPKYFPDLDSKKFYFWNLVTGQACAIFSKCLSPHWEITLVSGCWHLLTLCRVEVLIEESVFFSAPGLSFQGERLPTKHHAWPPSTSAPLRSFPSTGFKRWVSCLVSAGGRLMPFPAISVARMIQWARFYSVLLPWVLER